MYVKLGKVKYSIVFLKIFLKHEHEPRALPLAPIYVLWTVICRIRKWMDNQGRRKINIYHCYSLLLSILESVIRYHEHHFLTQKKYESYFFLLLDLLLSILLVNNGHNRTMCLVYFIPVLKVLCLNYTEGHWYCTFFGFCMTGLSVISHSFFLPKDENMFTRGPNYNIC